MSIAEFWKGYKHQSALASLTQRARNSYDAIKNEADEAIKSGQEELVQGIEQAKQSYGQKIGLPTAESSSEEKEAYRAFMNNIGSQFKKQRDSLIGGEMMDAMGRIGQAGNTLQRFQKLYKDEYSVSEINDVITSGLSSEKIHTGIIDVFNRTATARATAKGITRFKATDGVLDTIDSFRSLFYKDNEHFSNKGIAAMGIGTAGAAAGVYGIARD